MTKEAHPVSDGDGTTLTALRPLSVHEKQRIHPHLLQKLMVIHLIAVPHPITILPHLMATPVCPQLQLLNTLPTPIIRRMDTMLPTQPRTLRLLLLLLFNRLPLHRSHLLLPKHCLHPPQLLLCIRHMQQRHPPHRPTHLPTRIMATHLILHGRSHMVPTHHPLTAHMRVESRMGIMLQKLCQRQTETMIALLARKVICR